jgi:hypothetical protein
MKSEYLRRQGPLTLTHLNQLGGSAGCQLFTDTLRKHLLNLKDGSRMGAGLSNHIANVAGQAFGAFHP